MVDVNHDNSIRLLQGINIPKVDQLVHVAKKVWGHEEWIVNNRKYCGKKLVVKRGFRCSLHFHKIKDETFYILSGKILLETDYDNELQKRIMTVGDVVHIIPRMLHRFTGIEDTEMIEFSTFHREDDSYRLELSSKVNMKKLSI